MIRNLAAKGFPLAIYDASAERANGVRGALLQELKLPAEVFRFCVCVHASVSVSASYCAFGCVWYMYVHPIIYAMRVEDTRLHNQTQQYNQHNSTNTQHPGHHRRTNGAGARPALPPGVRLAPERESGGEGMLLFFRGGVCVNMYVEGDFVLGITMDGQV